MLFCRSRLVIRTLGSRPNNESLILSCGTLSQCGGIAIHSGLKSRRALVAHEGWNPSTGTILCSRSLMERPWSSKSVHVGSNPTESATKLLCKTS